ncbi:hypothetical protein A3K86_03385 [Photobacterium jeanii]|uniref:DUF3899 domain-containing protein n=1 Tax=Photobacterium jeanii TaxID=858640 RepID=A0A178KLU6_9GAMM|nr:hypothetical protein [Photobacterium jeanii]OAN17975.1 hypothetical protein A3K86_03385 [Photobacterium jeanii]PST92355.1 hypothetical protein C9I91_04060 [Photobacterium jeanii]
MQYTRNVLAAVFFIAISHGVIFALLKVGDWLWGAIEIRFLSDYFFYALVIQWAIGAFFLFSTPRGINHLHHSPSKATRMAASLADESTEASHQTTVDLGLSTKLFISGAFSLLVCLLI